MEVIMTSRIFKTCTWAVSLAALMLLHAGCKKERLRYTITATLLLSVRDPKPVSNYALRVYQRADAGLFGGISGFEQYKVTDAQGSIRFSYGLGREYGFSGDDKAPNHEPISISSYENSNYLGSELSWYPIPPNKDTSLGTMYLCTTVDNLVRKIDFHKSLPANDSIFVRTSGMGKWHIRVVRGPVSAGTMLTLDTIFNYKTDDYWLREKTFLCTTSIDRMPWDNALHSKIPTAGVLWLDQTIHYR
jgi:hypothetical protein